MLAQIVQAFHPGYYCRNPVYIACKVIAMTNEISAGQALLNLLRAINPPIGEPLGMFQIGIPLVVEQRYEQDEVVNELFSLQSKGLIELLGDNRLRLLKALPAS
ncbi:hypothetical protein [Pararhizobium sp.]|uniref:hypothetical protein n=1 Tax=Pararhizobium sp. TaxID=1977563 RepID=UPI003D1453F5